jgi:hypothetical protein
VVCKTKLYNTEWGSENFELELNKLVTDLGGEIYGHFMPADNFIVGINFKTPWKTLGVTKNCMWFISLIPSHWWLWFDISKPIYLVLASTVINLYVMHYQFNIQQLFAMPTLYLCVLYLSDNKQRLVSLTA